MTGLVGTVPNSHDRFCSPTTILSKRIFTDFRTVRIIVFHFCLKTTLSLFCTFNLYNIYKTYQVLSNSRFTVYELICFGSCLQQTALHLSESGTEVIGLFSVSLNTTGSLFRFFISTAPHVLHCISLSACDTRASLGRPGFSCYSNAADITASELRIQRDSIDKTKHKGIHKNVTQ